MKKTQEDIVVRQLLDNKQVSRNWCLQRYITRLGAIICDLNKEGWKIEGKFIKTDHGKDYIYYATSAPYKKVVYKVGGEIVASAYDRT